MVLQIFTATDIPLDRLHYQTHLLPCVQSWVRKHLIGEVIHGAGRLCLLLTKSCAELCIHRSGNLTVLLHCKCRHKRCIHFSANCVSCRARLKKRRPLPNSPLMNETELPSHNATNTKDYCLSAESKVEISRIAVGDEIGDSEMGEDEDFESEDRDEENDWSGQNDNLESVILEVLGDNLPLAAYLIPILHKAFYTEFQKSITKKVGPWQCGITKCVVGVGTTGSKQSSSSHGAANNSTHSNRKRQRFSGSGGNEGNRAEDREEDDDEDGDGRNTKNPGDNSDIGPSATHPRFACPFHKQDPMKYRVQHDAADNSKKPDYRTCAGPGFRNIQRLK